MTVAPILLISPDGMLGRSYEALLRSRGLAYTGGIAFYAAERLRYGHLVWHVFVLMGTTCHFVAVLRYAA